MRLSFRWLTLLAIPFFALACATASGGGSGSDDSAKNVLTAEQIEAARVPTAYDAVDRLRRVWFRDRATGAAVSVYMDNQRLQNGAEALRDIRAEEVAELQYLNGTDAVLRWGADARGGAIIVVRKR